MSQARLAYAINGRGLSDYDYCAPHRHRSQRKEEVTEGQSSRQDVLSGPAAVDDASGNGGIGNNKLTGIDQQVEPSGQNIAGDDYEREADVTPLHAALRHCAILGLLSFSSIWGLLTREGLVALNTFDGQSIHPLIWAQAVGCLVMGWTVANKDILEAWYPPFFVMLGTGYCGSVTTFSSWILQVFQAYGNQNHYNRTGLYNVMDALTQTFATLCISLAALAAGKALARVVPATFFYDLFELLKRYRLRRAIRPGRPASPNMDPSDGQRAKAQQKRSAYPPTSGTARFVTSRNLSHPHNTTLKDLFCFLGLGVGFWLGAILLAALPPRANFRPLTFSMAFSPPGAILRWYLSDLNSTNASKRFPFWPLGTFIANILATLVICGLFVSQHYGPSETRLAASNTLSCQILYGLQEGFCGCLSTISTFAVELRKTKPVRRAVGYAVGSYVVGLVVCVLIIGAPWWSRGMDGSCAGLLSYAK